MSEWGTGGANRSLHKPVPVPPVNFYRFLSTVVKWKWSPPNALMHSESCNLLKASRAPLLYTFFLCPICSKFFSGMLFNGRSDKFCSKILDTDSILLCIQLTSVQFLHLFNMMHAKIFIAYTVLVWYIWDQYMFGVYSCFYCRDKRSELWLNTLIICA
jgi:hypothetical protein